jgi:PDZ domain
MKYLLTILLFVIITGCSNHASKNDISSANSSVKTVFILPKDAFPFQFDGRHIIVQAKMNDSVEISLLLDTGVQAPLFDSSFVAENKDRLDLKIKPYHGAMESPSGIFRISQKITGTIKLNAISENKDFSGYLPIADRIKSTLGADAVFPAYLLFENKIVLIDLKDQYFRILSQDTLNDLKRHFVSFPLKGSQYSFFTISSKISTDKPADHTVTLDGDLEIDIGAPGFLYLFKCQKYVASVFPPDIKTHKIKTLAFNMKDSVYSYAFVVDRLRLSDTWSFWNAKITLLDQFVNLDPTQIGLLGNDFLSKFIVIIDYMNKQLYLRPGPEYFSPCKNSNLGMKLSKDQGAMSYIVSSLYDQTPISIAGIQLGDKILSINGISTEGIKIGEMDSIQRSPIGTKLNFRIQRGQIVFDREITIRNIW